jgi:hypothetical protein
MRRKGEMENGGMTIGLDFSLAVVGGAVRA